MRKSRGEEQSAVSVSSPAMASVWLIAAALLLFPATTNAQRSDEASYIEGRLNGIQRQLTELSAKIEQIRAQDQQLQRRLEDMRTRIEARLERLETGGTPSKPKGKAKR